MCVKIHMVGSQAQESSIYVGDGATLKAICVWMWCPGTFATAPLKCGPEGSRLAHVRGLDLAHAALKTAVCRSEVGVGLSEDSAKLAKGIRRMGG